MSDDQMRYHEAEKRIQRGCVDREQQLEGLVSARTLEKGLDHYESGAVSDLKTTECGYEAVVLGSREYHVEIELNDGEISGMYCDCPYADDGSFCKHMAAVLFEIDDQEEDETEDEREPSGTYSISQAVGALPEAYLRKLVIELAQRDEALKDQLLSEYEERWRIAGRKAYAERSAAS